MTKVPRRLRSLALGALLLPAMLPLASHANTPEDAADAGGGWLATRLDLDVTPRLADSLLHVEGTLSLRLEADRSQGPVLTLNTRAPWLRFLRVETPGGVAVLNDSVSGTPGLVTARLRLSKPVKKGARIDVRFACEGAAKGFQLQVRPDIAIASWVEGWYPSPLGSAGADVGDPAPIPGTTRFHLPRGWRSVSNGRRISSGECDGLVCEEWRTEESVMRSFSAAPYRVTEINAGTLRVGIYAAGARQAVVERKADVLAKALAAMEERFGPYPYPNYAIVEVPEDIQGWSASSEQGFILVKTSILDSERENLPLFAHEAAHGWWGNLVRSTDPGAKFCSESLAEYAAVTAIEALEGSAAATEFLEYSREGYNPLQSAVGYFYMWRDGGDKPMAELAQDRWDHNLSDSKGAWVLHMLRGLVGDDAFFGTLRGVIREFRGASISLRDLEAAFANAAPDRDVRGFFRTWLYGRGAPILDLDWWSVDRGEAVSIRLRQLQAGAPFRLRLPIEVTDRGGRASRDTLMVSERDSTYRLDTAARPLLVRLDPDRTLLLWRPEYGPRPDSTTASGPSRSGTAEHAP